jgi:hypothetical protein
MSALNLRNLPEVVRFVQAARAYCDLVECPNSDTELWVKGLLQSVSQLYSSVLQLPDLDVEEFDKVPDIFDIDHGGWQGIWNRIGNLLGEARWYWAYFDPTEPLDSEEKPLVGDLADDLADIYLDIKPGLAAWDTGIDEYVPEILWDWKEICFDSHWGLHAVDALRALHRLVYLRGLPDA